jgi:hypothetical protein
VLDLSLEGQAEGHVVGLGISGHAGVKTLETRPGIRATVGAGLTAIVGGELNLTANVSVAPRVVSAYNSAVSYTADLFEKVLGPHK